MLNNQRGSAMVTVIALAIILNITLLAFFFATRQTSKASGNRRQDITALNIAEAGKERLYAEIRSDALRPALNAPQATIYTDVALNAGRYTVWYKTDPWADTIWINSSAVLDGSGRKAVIDVMGLIPGDTDQRRTRPRRGDGARQRRGFRQHHY